MNNEKVYDALAKAFGDPGVPERNMLCLDCTVAWWPEHDGERCPQCCHMGIEFFVKQNPDLKSWEAYSEPMEIRGKGRTEDIAIRRFFEEAS